MIRLKDLRESESRLRAVVSTAVDGVILIDHRGNILMFNPACERLFGYRAEEVTGENVKILMPNQYSKEHDRYLEPYRKPQLARQIREMLDGSASGTS